MWFNGAYTYTGSTRANQIIASYIPRSQSCSFYGTAACTSPSGTPRYGLLQGIALSKTKPRNPGMKSTLQGPLISQAAEEACTARNRASSSCAAASMRPKSASDGRFAPCKPVHVPSSPGDRWQHAQPVVLETVNSSKPALLGTERKAPNPSGRAWRSWITCSSERVPAARKNARLA